MSNNIPENATLSISAQVSAQSKNIKGFREISFIEEVTSILPHQETYIAQVLQKRNPCPNLPKNLGKCTPPQ